MDNANVKKYVKPEIKIENNNVEIDEAYSAAAVPVAAAAAKPVATGAAMVAAAALTKWC